MAKAFGAYVHLKVAETQSQLQNMINTSFANTKLYINTIDISAAKESLYTQLQTMLSEVGRNLNLNLRVGSGGTSEQSASSEERAAHAAAQRLNYNEQNHRLEVDTANLERAETDRMNEQLRLLSQVIQMRSALIELMKSGVVSSDANGEPQAILNTLNNLQSGIVANLTPTKEELSDFKVQVSGAQVAMRALNEELIQMGNIGSPTTQAERFSTLEKKLLTLRTQINAILNGNSKLRGTPTGDAFESLQTQVDKYLGSLRRLRDEGKISGQEFNTMTAEINRMTVGFKAAKDEMVEFGLQGNTAFTRLIKGFQKFGGWMIVTRALSAVIRLGRQMVTNIKEIDAAMTQLRIVTRASSTEISQFGDSVAKTAKEIGASIVDLTESATTYARLGYSLQESSVLAKYTSMLKAVGDIEVSDAQDAITAITKAFNIDASQIETVMNKLVVVGKYYCPAA